MPSRGVHADVPGDIERCDNVRLTLRTRTPVCGARSSAVDRLKRLQATGAIAEFEVRTWPDQVALSEASTDDEAVRTFERFERWADERGASVRPAFRVRTVSSLVGESQTVLTLPMVSLAVHSGADLVGVFPRQEEGRTWTVEDCLDGCERAAVDAHTETEHAHS
jgi:hypothetical protein